MAAVYSLKVTQMDTLPQAAGQANVVTRVHWAYTGTESGRSAGFGGSTEVHYAPGDPFIEYPNLNENQVANWVLAAWSDNERDRYQSAIANQLAVQAEALPWTPPAETNEPQAD